MISLSHAAWAIVNSIWQGAAVAAIAWVALRLFRRASAAVRYHVWAAVLVAAIVLPVMNFVVPERILVIGPSVAVHPQVQQRPSLVHASTHTSRATAIAVSPAAAAAAMRRNAAAPVLGGHTAAHAPVSATVRSFAAIPAPEQHVAGEVKTIAPLASASERLRSTMSTIDLGAIGAGQRLQARIAFAFIAWLAFAVLLFARLGWGLYRLRTIKRGLVRIDDPLIDALCRSVSRRVTVASSEDVGSPCVIGYVHPVVALPSSLVRTLGAIDLQRVLAHELGHVRRYDDWANLIQQCIRAALCFNPVVHAACRALDVNREIACDDLVAAGLADRIEYAKCLTEIARRGAFVEHLVPAAGFFPDRRQIVVRIEQLLDRDHPGSASVGVVPAASAIAVVIAVAALALHQLPALAISAPAAKPAAAHAATVMAVRAQSPERAGAPAAAAAVPVVPTWTAAELDKARSAETAALYEMPSKAPVLPPADVERIARARAALAVAHEQMAPVSAHALDAVLLRAPRLALQMAQSQVAVAPRAAMAMATTSRLAIAQSQLALAPRSPMAPTSEDDFLDALAAAGYSHLSVDDLIAIRDSGVTGSYLRSLKQYGILPMPVKSLIALADSGVSAATIASMSAAGYTGLKAADLISLQNSGVTPSFVLSAKASLRPAPTVSDLVTLANSGVTPEYIDALAKSGYARLSATSIVKLQNAGVSSTYLIDLAKLGHVGMSVDSLIALANAGVSPDYIRGLAELGYSSVSTDDLIRMMDAGVTPDLIKRLREHGFSGALSVDELIKLAENGF